MGLLFSGADGAPFVAQLDGPFSVSRLTSLRNLTRRKTNQLNAKESSVSQRWPTRMRTDDPGQLPTSLPSLPPHPSRPVLESAILSRCSNTGSPMSLSTQSKIRTMRMRNPKGPQEFRESWPMFQVEESSIHHILSILSLHIPLLASLCCKENHK